MLLQLHGLSIKSSVRTLLRQATFVRLLIIFSIPNFLLAWTFHDVPDFETILYQVGEDNGYVARNPIDKLEYLHWKYKHAMRENIRQNDLQWEKVHHPERVPAQATPARVIPPPPTKDEIDPPRQEAYNGYFDFALHMMQVVGNLIYLETRHMFLKVASAPDIAISLISLLLMSFISFGMVGIGFRLGAKNMAILPPVTMGEMLRLIGGGWYSICLWPLLFTALFMVLFFWPVVLGLGILAVLPGIWLSYREIQGSHRRWVSFCLTEDWRVLFDRKLRAQILSDIDIGRFWTVLTAYSLIGIFFAISLAGFELMMLGVVALLSKIFWPKLLLVLGLTIQAMVAYAFMAAIGHMIGQFFFRMQAKWPYRNPDDIPLALRPTWQRGWQTYPRKVKYRIPPRRIRRGLFY